MPGLVFSKDFRVLASKEFASLHAKGRKIRERCLRGYCRNSPDSPQYTRIGISVSRKVGKALVRNRVKRILREFFRQSPYRFLGKDLMIVVSPKLFSLYKKREEAERVLLGSFASLLGKIGEGTNV